MFLMAVSVVLCARKGVGYALPSPRAGMSWPVLSLKVLFAMVRVLGVVLLGVMWMEGWW